MAAITPIIRKLIIEQNADFSETYSLVSNGSPVDLTGCSVKCQVRQEMALNGTLLLTFDSTLDDGSCTIDADAETITLYVPQALAKTLVWDNPAYYDLIITWSDGTTNRLFGGRAVFDLGVTEPDA